MIDVIDLVMQLSETEDTLNKANETIKNLKEEKEKKDSDKLKKNDDDNYLKKENELLKLTHDLCMGDIKTYNENILKLKEEERNNNEKILRLKEENDKLKKEKNKKNKKDSKEFKNMIFNIKDITKTLRFQIKNLPNEQNENENDNEEDVNIININNNENEEEKKMENFEKIKHKKEEFEKILKDLKNKSNQFNTTLHEQTETINKHRVYLNEVYQYITALREQINVSVIGYVSIVDDNGKINEINLQFDNCSSALAELDSIIFKIKNNFGANIENLLNGIQTNIDDLDKDENKNEINFNNISKEIHQKIDEIKEIFSDFEKNKDNYNSKNNILEEKIEVLKNLHKELVEFYKNKRQKDQNINNNNIFNYQNENKNQNIIINNKNKDYNKMEKLEQSFLFNIKEEVLKMDIYKTVNLFGENEQDLIEMYIDEPHLLRKNYHEICYIYDDYDIYDIYYDLKAVGLSNNSYFPKSIFPFYYSKIIEIQSFFINDVPSEYKMNNHSFEFNVNLRNLQTKKIHFTYKAIKDLSLLSEGEKEERNIYRSDYYGIDKSFAGQMAKFSLILKGSFDIVNFDDYFLVRNINNKNEVEYMWGGRVPYQGKRTLIMFSKKEAIWSFYYSSKFHSNNNIKNTKYYIPIEFIGGNNEIININPTSPQATNIIIDEENRQYIAEYKNTQYKEAEFIIKGELRNKCKGEWEVDLTDEEIEKRMPQEDVLCKPQLQIIAKEIIDKFDKNNKDSDFIYLDYMKIGLWVYKNIKYDYNYIGETQFSAVDIYNKKVGVCHHFTRLSNALLYALGYKVIYVSGYTCKKNKIFKTDTGHAWSLIKLENNKWYPFDSTWGILSGKLPVSHIFATFFSRSGRLYSYDSARFNKHEMEGKFIES